MMNFGCYGTVQQANIYGLVRTSVLGFEGGDLKQEKL